MRKHFTFSVQFSLVFQSNYIFGRWRCMSAVIIFLLRLLTLAMFLFASWWASSLNDNVDESIALNASMLNCLVILTSFNSSIQAVLDINRKSRLSVVH